jgi:CelD/BcsL family acetyltransferase involved in cellulose biosynthesis
MTAVEEISSIERLEGLRDAWEEAQARCAPDNIFVTFDWALAWWRHFGAGRRLRVLVLRDGGRPSVILPLWEGPLWHRWAPFRKIQLLGTGLSDRLDVFLSKDSVESAERALRHLLDRPVHWDVLDLRDMPEGSPAVQAIRTAATRLGLKCEISVDSETPYIPIESNWETFFTTRFGRRWRKTLRHNARRLEAECGPVRTTFNATPDASLLLSRLAAMPQDGQYHGTDRRSIFGSGPKRAFFEDIAERFSRRGWLRVSVLELAGEVSAFRFGFQYAGKYFDYFTGFHRDQGKLSPGTVLLTQVVEDCFQNGLREVDFLRGAEPWKAVWTDRRRQNLRVRVYRPGLRQSVIRLLFRVKDGAKGSWRRGEPASGSDKTAPPEAVGGVTAAATTARRRGI